MNCVRLSLLYSGELDKRLRIKQLNPFYPRWVEEGSLSCRHEDKTDCDILKEDEAGTVVSGLRHRERSQ